MEIFNTKPSDSRSIEENKVYHSLEYLGISFLRVDHKKAMTMEDCDEIEETLQTHIYKNLFLVNSNKSQYYLLITLGNKQFKTKDVSKQINSSRLSFGNEEKMVEYLNCTKGSASILELLFDTSNKVQLLVDEDLLHDDYFAAHPCKNTSSLKLSTKDLYDKILPYCKHDYITVKI